MSEWDGFRKAMDDRARKVNSVPPHLVADVVFYTAEEKGYGSPRLPGWGCICCTKKFPNGAVIEGYDAWPQLETPLSPGERRRIGFVFLTSGDEGAEAMRKAGRFYLWEGRYVGEATVII